MSFFLGSWDMNRSAEQTNRTRTASRFTRFVCSALRFISHEPRKKDTHSLIKHFNNVRGYKNSSVKKVRINKQPGRFLKGDFTINMIKLR